MRPLAVIKGALGSLLVLAIVIRTVNWLLAPSVSLIIILFVLVSLIYLALFGRRH